MDEMCICAAVKTKTGIPIRGHRHSDCIRTIFDMKELPETQQQGFITSTGRFVSREEGYWLQRIAEIPSMAKGGYRGERLFSEDLY